MDENTRRTIGYYDANAAGSAAETAGAEFVRSLPRGGRILDLGCESGRASLGTAEDCGERHSGRLSRPFQGQGRETPTRLGSRRIVRRENRLKRP